VVVSCGRGETCGNDSQISRILGAMTLVTYVDDMYLHYMGRFGRMKMSHMIADTHKELVDMAFRIGVKERWIQHRGTPGEHFDVCMSARQAAIDCGAVPITLRQCAIMSMRRRIEGKLGAPVEALEWMLERSNGKRNVP
jgi:hypothetical protein